MNDPNTSRYDYAEMERLGSLGLDYGEVAGVLAISRRSFERHRNADPLIDEAIHRGRSTGVSEVLIALRDLAIRGKDLGAMKLYLNSLGANFGKAPKIEVNAKNIPSIIINLSKDPSAP